MASAMERGSATTATMTPETTSLGSCRLSSSLSECLMMLKSIGLILSRCNALLFHVVASARCARKSVPPGSTGRNASEYYAVGFDFAPRHYTARLQEGNKSGKCEASTRAEALCRQMLGVSYDTRGDEHSVANGRCSDIVREFVSFDAFRWSASPRGFGLQPDGQNTHRAC